MCTVCAFLSMLYLHSVLSNYPRQMICFWSQQEAKQCEIRVYRSIAVQTLQHLEFFWCRVETWWQTWNSVTGWSQWAPVLHFIIIAEQSGAPLPCTSPVTSLRGSRMRVLVCLLFWQVNPLQYRSMSVWLCAFVGYSQMNIWCCTS